MRGIPIRRVIAPLVAGVLFLGLVASPAARAGKTKQDDGIPITVLVKDTNGNPVATAVVRNPKEEERHRVNTVTGSWVGSILYLPDGSMIKFAKGMEVTFEVSAPGYVTQTVHYIVRKRKNVIVVPLEQMKLDDSSSKKDDDSQMPIIGFGRDKPIGGEPIPPDNGGDKGNGN